MFKRTLTGSLVGALALGLSLTACSSGSTNGAGAGVPTVKIMVGGLDKQIYLPFQLAQQLGFYQKYGVNVVLSTEDASVGAEDAMLSGQVDMAGAWYNHTIELQAKGKSVEDIVQLSGAPGEREMCATKSGVHSGADFAGKTLGVTDLGSGTDVLTQLVAAQSKLTTSQFSRIGVGAGATAVAALQNGKTACVMTTQPTVTAIQKKGIGYSAVDLATTDGAKALLGGTWPSATALAKTEWVNSHKDAAQKVVTALVATMHWMDAHSATDIANALPPTFVSNSSVSKDDYIAALTQDKGQFLPDGIMPAGGPKNVLATEKLIGTKTDSVNLGTTFTNEFALNANKTLGVTPTTTPADSSG
ncbi:ABC transporter substrate-binding protein [Kitasatospora sp. MAP5-34]|uniref:ABC transporter substrate-binding protein n=1 Tax=Kitasatospora sp. MAP5-34 TaxID=3035102 RepID=UPI002473FBE7|nr:ABC transporter substrate-binding protein [Kitasatospora sp. MAP5-34]MDH6576576.1 NitT/TauT family transport system substrate-binding protein [Kitasatospora sp. MAP5-34]